MKERGETLTEVQLAEAQPQKQGRRVRAFCPFHGGDRQRSLSVDLDSGYFRCFACEVWGYMDWARERYRREPNSLPSRAFPAPAPVQKTKEAGPIDTLRREALMLRWVEQLPGSLGEEYLAERKIPERIWRRYGLGYAKPKEWPQRAETKNWTWGRLVAPHETPEGRLVNLYSRAVGEAPKTARHDHLRGPKGYFNGTAMARARRVYVCEGVMDALSLMAAGVEDAVAVFGVSGWRLDWLGGVSEVVFALDNDEAGRRALRGMARQLKLMGRRVFYLTDESLGGAKDVNEAWVSGSLRLSSLKDE